MTISNITINGHTYTDADWQANWEGTISAIANDIATIIAAESLVGVLAKSISGNTTLTGVESENLGFIFTGTLAATADITFAAGFEGMAVIVNSTSGGFAIQVSYGSGTEVEIPAGGAGVVFGTGYNFISADGLVATSTGAKVPGTLEVTGAATLSSTLAVTGAATFSGTLTGSGAATFSAALSVGTTLTVTGAATFSSSLSVTGALTTSASATIGTSMVVTAGLTANTISVASGATINGTGVVLTVAATSGEIRQRLSGPTGQSAWQSYQTTSLDRWLVGKNNTAESGSDAGANYDIIACDDSGNPLGVIIRCIRSSLDLVLPNLPTSSAGLSAGTVWSDSGTLKVV